MATETIERPRVGGPGHRGGRSWRVIVLNDNHNTFDHVARTLARVIPSVTVEQGYRIADQIHNTGQAIVWIGRARARRALLGAAQLRRPDDGAARAGLCAFARVDPRTQAPAPQPRVLVVALTAAPALVGAARRSCRRVRGGVCERAACTRRLAGEVAQLGDPGRGRRAASHGSDAARDVARASPGRVGQHVRRGARARSRDDRSRACRIRRASRSVGSGRDDVRQRRRVPGRWQPRASELRCANAPTGRGVPLSWP